MSHWFKMNSQQGSGRKNVGKAVGVGVGLMAGIAGGYLLMEYIKKTRNSQRVRDSLSSRRSSFTSCISEDDFRSALGSDDEEFFSAVSDLENILEENAPEELFAKIDELLEGNDKDRAMALRILKEHESEMSKIPDFLWRFAEAYQKQAIVYRVRNDMHSAEMCITEGCKLAKEALELDEENPDAHKWFAVLTGMKGELGNFTEKVESAEVFQKHIQIAIKLKPSDHSLYHMLGRFKYEIANISWLERKLAQALFQIPEYTMQDAIEDLLEAEKLNEGKCKKNKLLLAKCYSQVGKQTEAIKMLKQGRELPALTIEDKVCHQEIECTLEKLGSL